MVKKLIAVIVAALALLSGCATMVKIDANVKDATVIINDESVGQTPLVTSLSDFIFNQYKVRIEKTGYQTYEGRLQKDVKLVPVLFCWVYLVPLLWCYGPKSAQYFELKPETVGAAAGAAAPAYAGGSAPTLSVLEFKIDDKSAVPGITGMDLALYMETYLSQSGRFQLSNRLALKEVLSEKELQNTDLFNSKFAASLGSFVETQYLLVGQLRKIGDGYSIFVKIIDVRTNIQSVVYERGNLYIASGGINVLKDALKSIADEIAKSR